MKSLIALFSLALFASMVAAQSSEPGDCDHSSARISRFRSVRTMLPVKVTDLTATEIEVKAEDDVELLTFVLKRDATSDIPKDFKPEKGKLYWILYCEKDFHLYALWEYKPQKTSE